MNDLMNLSSFITKQPFTVKHASIWYFLLVYGYCYQFLDEIKSKVRLFFLSLVIVESERYFAASLLNTISVSGKSSVFQVLVLNRVTPQQYRKVNLPINYAPLPPLNVDPFSSNVYSIGEKIILAWANHHFQQQRDSWLWKASVTGMAQRMHLLNAMKFS